MKRVAIHSEFTTVECKPYHAYLTAKSCATRFSQANQQHAPTPRWNKMKNGCGDLSGCRGCPVGESVHKQLETLRMRKAATLLAKEAEETRARAEALRDEADELERAIERASAQAECDGESLVDDEALDAVTSEFGSNFVPTWKVRRSR